MKTMNEAKRERLIKEAHLLLDRIEARMKGIFDGIKEKQAKKAA